MHGREAPWVARHDTGHADSVQAVLSAFHLMPPMEHLACYDALGSQPWTLAGLHLGAWGALHVEVLFAWEAMIHRVDFRPASHE